MLVDDIGDVTITNDGATILRMLEVEHPAAKVIMHTWQAQPTCSDSAVAMFLFFVVLFGCL
jgi:chaperonin GroEL (HSP60 family)